MASPRITQCSWGEIYAEGFGKEKDLKLFPGGGRPWDWRETGTSHSVGVQVADLQELIELGCEIVIIAQGFEGRLSVSQEAYAYLDQHNIQYHTLKTESAVDAYNKLCASEKVGGLFHTTC